MQDSSELKDSEGKKALVQKVTCMEMISTKTKAEIKAFDTEILQ